MLTMFTRLVRGGNRGDARTGRQCVGNVQVYVLVCLGIVLGRTLLIQQQVFNVPNDPTLLIQIDALLSALDTPRNRTTPTTSNGGNLTVSYNLKVSSPPLTNQSLLCDECLQIVQRAPRIKLAKTASRNTTSPALDEYHRLRRERRHPFQGALDAHGRSGFQYDVTSLRRNPPSFVESFPNLTAECLRRDDEYYALQRLRIHSPSPEQSITATQLSQSSTPARILCIVYSSEPFHHKLQAVRQTWAHKCDGFVAASNFTDPTFDAVNIVHNGPEQYNNIWQKVRSIWATIYELYYEDFDWFHHGVEDMWVMVENLRMYLESDEIRAAANGGVSNAPLLGNQSSSSPLVPSDQVPLYLGSRLARAANVQTLFNSGGPGYTLNKAALKLLVTEGLPVMYKDVVTSAEDVKVAEIFRQFRILPYPTHDRDGGERYHHFTPGLHYLPAMPKPHDWLDMWARPLGRRGGANHSSVYSIAFHQVKPDEMFRFHALVYGYCDNIDKK
jgi:hypothetical protein